MPQLLNNKGCAMDSLGFTARTAFNLFLCKRSYNAYTCIKLTMICFILLKLESYRSVYHLFTAELNFSWRICFGTRIIFQVSATYEFIRKDPVTCSFPIINIDFRGAEVFSPNRLYAKDRNFVSIFINTHRGQYVCKKRPKHMSSINLNVLIISAVSARKFCIKNYFKKSKRQTFSMHLSDCFLLF